MYCNNLVAKVRLVSQAVPKPDWSTFADLSDHGKEQSAGQVDAQLGCPGRGATALRCQAWKVLISHV